MRTTIEGLDKNNKVVKVVTCDYDARYDYINEVMRDKDVVAVHTVSK